MPFVRNPRDRNKQIENQQQENNALRKDLGTVGSVGGALLQDTRTGGTSSAPTLTSPSPERKTTTPRATNLADLAAANIDKTQALSQDIASQQAGQVRDYNRRLGEAQADLQTGLDASPDPTRSKELVDTFRTKAKEGTLSGRDYTDLRGAFDPYQGPESLSTIDRGIAETEANIASQGRDLQTGASGALQQRLASEGTYSTGARNLDTALLGQQSNALQQTGRAGAGVGGQSQATDESIRNLANQRRTNLAELPGQVFEDTKTDFGQQQAGQTQRFQDLNKKLEDTKLETEAAKQMIADRVSDFNNKRAAFDELQGVKSHVNRMFGGDQQVYQEYHRVASDPQLYDAYLQESSDRDNARNVAGIEIHILKDYYQNYLPKLNELQAIVPRGQYDVDAAAWEVRTGNDAARKQVAENYLNNFNDAELSQIGVTREDVMKHISDNELDLDNITGLFQQMNLQPNINTQEDRDYIAALQHLARLSGGDLAPKQNTKTSKEEGE